MKVQYTGIYKEGACCSGAGAGIEKRGTYLFRCVGGGKKGEGLKGESRVKNDELSGGGGGEDNRQATCLFVLLFVKYCSLEKSPHSRRTYAVL